MAVDHALRRLAEPTRSYAPVPEGPRAYRRAVRRKGPLAAFVPPVVLGLIGMAMLNGSTSVVRGLGGFLAACLAAPGLLIAGIPFADGTGRVLLGIAISAAVWLGVGVWAAMRATRLPVAMWRDYWREYAWLAVGVWLGVVGAVIGANLFLGQALL